MDNEAYLMTLLKVVRNNQEFYMRQQWKVTNYALVLYGSIIYVLNNIFNWNINCTVRIIFASISVVIFLIAIFLICMLENSTRETRKIANEIYKRVPAVNDVIHATIGHRAGIRENDETLFRKSVVFIFGIVIFFACAVVLWILIKTIDC
jgi:hypothetical protein